MDTVLRGVAVYLFLLFITRILGRRSLAQVTPFDVVLLLIIAETTQQALLGDDFSLTNAAVLLCTLAFVDIALSYVKARSPVMARLIDGEPTVLVSGGVPDDEALRRARVGLVDVLAAARKQHGLKGLADIDIAVLEVDGAISIIPNEPA